ncbi:MAG: tRNA (adenosine(37)-N6)-dimethylallyltransferase MiaA [Corynebacterium sp.]|nr:tRNA (adenosine(37)-N6)-dimethylallyltransferase MiaA [Corynebacterium sp.]
MSSNQRPIAIIGPTASGKSALSIALAQLLDGEIVNVDSMQLYKGMDIGTAKLSIEERAGIPHHQLDVLEVTEPASVARYQQEAIGDVEAIRTRNKRPIFVGGSMLYIQALVDDWQFPPTDPAVRAKYQRRQDEIGVVALHAELEAIDPAAAKIIEQQDPRRIVRALEVIELTGQPFQASQPPRESAPRWNTHIFGLATQRDWIVPRIEQRTQQMFTAGFVNEVQGLQTQGLVADSTAGRAIGYAQVLAHLQGEYDVETAEELTCIATRKYVRRQRSWFRRDPRTHWIDATLSLEEQVSAVRAQLAVSE